MTIEQIKVFCDASKIMEMSLFQLARDGIIVVPTIYERRPRQKW